MAFSIFFNNLCCPCPWLKNVKVKITYIKVTRAGEESVINFRELGCLRFHNYFNGRVVASRVSRPTVLRVVQVSPDDITCCTVAFPFFFAYVYRREEDRSNEDTCRKRRSVVIPWHGRYCTQKAILVSVHPACLPSFPIPTSFSPSFLLTLLTLPFPPFPLSEQ